MISEHALATAHSATCSAIRFEETLKLSRNHNDGSNLHISDVHDLRSTAELLITLYEELLDELPEEIERHN